MVDCSFCSFACPARFLLLTFGIDEKNSVKAYIVTFSTHHTNDDLSPPLHWKLGMNNYYFTSHQRRLYVFYTFYQWRTLSSTTLKIRNEQLLLYITSTMTLRTTFLSPHLTWTTIGLLYASKTSSSSRPDPFLILSFALKNKKITYDSYFLFHQRQHFIRSLPLLSSYKNIEYSINDFFYTEHLLLHICSQ